MAKIKHCEVLPAVTMKIVIFWDVMPCCLSVQYKCTNVMPCCLSVQYKCTNVMSCCLSVQYKCTNVMSCCLSVQYKCTNVMSCCLSVQYKCTTISEELAASILSVHSSLSLSLYLFGHSPYLCLYFLVA